MHRQNYLISLVVFGVFVMLIAELLLFGMNIPWLVGGELFLAGICCRAMRRYLYFKKETTLHQIFSFEFLFQGFTAINPQLSYPYVEMNFLKRHVEGIDEEKLKGWFSIRYSSAIAIPLVLAAAYCFTSGEMLLSVLFFILAMVFVATAQNTLSCFFGVLAVLLEMELFMVLVGSDVSKSLACASFGVAFLIFELSPIPLSLGIVEIVFGGAMVIFSLPKEMLFAPLCYRLFRAAPLLAGMLFYMPRYKLSLQDLFHPHLASLLLQQWKPKEVAGACHLSIVIPAYNEEKRLPSFLEGVMKLCDELQEREGKVCEVIVVDDGSLDNTGQYVQSMMEKWPQLKLLQEEKNRGKGFAVQKGILQAAGNYILFADADGSTPIVEAKKLLKLAESGNDVVIGIRQSSMQEMGKGPLRGLMSLIFYRLTNLLVVPGIVDTQCGFKMFRRAAAHRLFHMPKEAGWTFDIEILFLAQKFGMQIAQVPVAWRAMAQSKVKPVKDSLNMFEALWRIRKRWAGISS